jgi:hypothetical protein
MPQRAKLIPEFMEKIL